MSRDIGTVTAGTVQPKANRSLVVLVSSTFRAACEPNHVPQPVIDPELTELPTFERIAEVLRYKILQLEYELSSHGGLRAYIKLILFTCLLLGIPAVFVAPIITLLLGQFVTMSAYLLQAVQNILYTVICIIGMVVIVWVVILLLFKHR